MRELLRIVETIYRMKRAHRSIYAEPAEPLSATCLRGYQCNVSNFSLLQAVLRLMEHSIRQVWHKCGINFHTRGTVLFIFVWNSLQRRAILFSHPPTFPTVRIVDC